MAAGVSLPLVAFGLQTVLWPFIPPSPHLLFYPAVLLAARLAGARAGYVASAVSVVAVAYGFMPPVESLRIDSARDALELGIFFGVAVALSALVGRLRDAVARERAARIATDETWAMIAHDLKTPLSTIEMGSKQLAQRLMQGGGDLSRAARVIERSSGRALSLLQDAVDAVKLGEGAFRVEPGPCDLRELFAHVIEGASTLAAQGGVRLDMDVSTTRSVWCDEPRVAQVLQNLVVNALHFTRRGGSVSLVADDDDDAIRISVRDTGVGIAAEALGSIFDKHWTTGGGGSGLGLWIVQRIVEAHGSHVEVESALGVGSTFSFTLPALEDVRRDPRSLADEPPPESHDVVRAH